MIKKTLSLIIAFVMLSSCMTAFADTSKLSSECITELSAVYTATDAERVRLDISANVSDIAADEYIVFTVYASVNDIADPTNGGENSLLTMQTRQASQVISDGKLSYSIDYYSSEKLSGKIAVCLQVANRGAVNDWAKAYAQAKLTVVTDAKKTQEKQVLAPAGFPLNGWLDENLESLGVTDDWNVFMGWTDAEGEEYSDETTIPVTGLTAYSKWRLFADFDNDGVVTVADALVSLRVVAKLADETEEILLLGDTDRDEKTTVADSLAILRYVAKLTDSWD